MNIASTVANFAEGQQVTVCGRVRFIRSFGKLAFLRIADSECEIQIGLKGKHVLPDHWDFIQASGITGLTKLGERTVWVENYTVLAKCHRSPSDKYHGMADKGELYRKRYLDCLSNPESLKLLIERSKIVSAIRRFFEDRGFLEIETPILSCAATGAAAEPFKTHHKAKDREMFLRIATEISLKKAIISGMEKVFEIGKIFRNEGEDWKHNPEFTSIEAYQAFASLDDMKHLFADLIDHLTGTYPEIPSYDYSALVEKHGKDFDSNLDNLCYVEGHPIEESPLCKKRDDGKADRFEVFARGYEIANAFNEINTHEEQASRIKPGEDDGLLDALTYGMPPCGGIGIGIDRLVMFLTNSKHIKDVIFFPVSE